MINTCESSATHQNHQQISVPDEALQKTSVQKNGSTRPRFLSGVCWGTPSYTELVS